MAKKGFETSKEYTEKTGVWSYERLKNSRFVFKDITSYEELTKEKKFIIFCIQENSPFIKDFLLFLPILFTKVWIESGSLRILIKDISPEIEKKLEIESFPSVFIKSDNEQIRKITTEVEIQDLMKNFTFHSEKGDLTTTPLS
jgi:hypothetical protein